MKSTSRSGGAAPFARALAALLLAHMIVASSAGAAGEGDNEGWLQVAVLDEHGQETPSRIRLTNSRGQVAPLPKEAVAVMYGHWDHADGYGYQPDSSFYGSGSFGLALEPGRYRLSVSKGHEYLPERRLLHVSAGDTLREQVRLERWIDLPAMGWYSSDNHIHIRRSPREDSLLLAWTQAEDVHVGVLLRMGDFWEIYYPQYAWGEEGVYQRGDYLLTSGQEDPRTPELGHAIGMGMSDRVRNADEYYLYDRVFDRIRDLGGVAGYAHHAETFHGYRGLILDGLRGKVDVLELLQFCAPEGPLVVDHYYHLLDLGFPVTAVAGSDFPWCGKDHRYGLDVAFESASRIGNARFYTLIDGPLTYASWKEAVHAGRTFVSSGPALLLRVNGLPPGSHLDVSEGDTLQISVEARGHEDAVPLSNLEIVIHGAVVAETGPGDPGQSADHLSLSLDVPVHEGMWIAARAAGDRFTRAHTTPVYVTIDGGGFHNRATVSRYLDLSETYLRELEAEIAEPVLEPEMQAWRYRDELQARIDETRDVMEALRDKLAAPHGR